MGRRKKSRRHQEKGRTPKRPSEASLPMGELLVSATESVEAAISALARTRAATEPDSVGDPCGPLLGAVGVGGTSVDPVLRDRYEGLLTRSGVVAGSIHTLPSRLRERTEQTLGELIAGVARDDTLGARRVEGMVADLMVLLGQRIVADVERWRREQAAGSHGSAPAAGDTAADPDDPARVGSSGHRPPQGAHVTADAGVARQRASPRN